MILILNLHYLIPSLIHLFQSLLCLPLNLKKSTKVHKLPSYLQDYSCSLLTTKPTSSIPYYIAQHLSYANISTSHQAFALAVNAKVEPEFYHQAMLLKAWQEAMDKEISALELNHTWDVVHLPPSKNPIGCKWVYRIKYNPDGSVERYKARLVAKGYTQQEGLDYSKNFSPVAKSVSVRVLLFIAAIKGWPLHQLEVNNAFLHGNLDEEVYMSLPQGFHSKGGCSTNVVARPLVCRLRKSLYG